MNVKNLRLKANTIRKHIIEMLEKAGSGHTGGSLGMADVVAALYFNEMNHDPKKPLSKTRDYFLLSNGHTCPVLYAALAESGYFPIKELSTLRQLDSRLQGHPHVGALPGVENSGGPLGQGLSQAVGLAASLKRDKKKNRVYCYVGDGELEEGQCWEALMFAAKEELDNLVVIIDRNHIQIDGTTEEVLSPGPFDTKFRSFGFRVIEFNGNNMNQIVHAFKETKKMKGKPLCFVAESVPGKGVSFMEGDYHWHGKAPSKEEAQKALLELEEIEKEIKKGEYK